LARRIRRPLGPLDLRSQAILRAVIEEYVTTAQPVGSLALVERYGLGVSSATVRNILAELEMAGLLTHPHTSAGRMPTDAGYRFYVESIVDASPLSAVEQLMIRHQFGQVEYASEHWFRLAATTLAGLTRSAGLATPAKPSAAHIRRVDLVAVNERMASLILVLREATLVRLDEREPIQRVAQYVGARIVRILRDYDAATVEEVFSDGLLNVMEAPEFAQSDKLRQVFTALENRAYLGELVDSVAASSRIRVVIGAENALVEMHDVSLVLAPYGRPGRALGVVGVLGPTRMSYPHAIGTVTFVSGLMNELVDHLYA
jgi:heat-inducible transcriptional repressor